jgi:4-carboxymuconolactone decarboxylase
MARIPLFPMDDMTPEQRRVMDEIVRGPRGGLRGPLRAVLHCPELADRWQKLGELLRFRTSLPPRLSELAILVTARHFDAQYEWFAHEPHAVNAGVPPTVIEAIKHGKRPSFAQVDEEALYDYCIELHMTHVVSEPVYQRAIGQFGVAGVVEITALIGYYAMVAMTLNAHEISVPPDAPPPLPALT